MIPVKSFDPCIGLCDSGAYSHSDGKSAWHDVTAADLQAMLEGPTPPMFRTVLARHGEDTYEGPLYLDIDCGAIDEAIEVMWALVDKLEATGLDLDAVRFFATGGRGFHAEIPQACVMPTPGPLDDLPRMYKAVVLTSEIYVDGIDTRVYSCGRGRMWRVPNVQRENGAYKVPCTAAEIRALTPETYAELCSAPRAFPALAEPRLCPGMAALFVQARDKAGAKTTRARKWSAAEEAVRSRFTGTAPPSLRQLLDGKVQARQGWNQVALQLSLLAHALDWDEDRLVTEARGLIESHQSDGHRYNSPRKREHDLRRMFNVAEGNTTYAFSVPALKSLLPKGTPTPDLNGLEADADEGENDTSASDTASPWELLTETETVSEVVRLARRYAADATATRSEVEAFIKHAAKTAGVSLKTMRSDVFVASEDGAEVSKPIIPIVRSDFAASVRAVLDVLPSVPNLRVRSGQLVEITRAGADHRVSPVSVARLAHLVSDRARWGYGDAFGGPDVACLQSVMACPAWPGVPTLETLVHQPCVRIDGTLIAEPGNYSGMEATFSRGQYKPFLGSGAEALQEIRGLLEGFPFEDGVSESAAVAAILTAAIRPMLRTAPAFVISASDLGSGKTYLAELITLFAGSETAMRRWPQRSEDQDKVLLSALIECSPTLLFDNLMVPLRSASLAAILTNPQYSDRVLGSSVTASVSTRALFVFTGNQLHAMEDMSRRVVPIILDASCENPASRAFSRDPVREVREDRNAWVMKTLRVLQAFLESGEAPQMTPIASFADWTRVVRGAVAYFGLSDPGAALLKNVAHDPDRETLGLLLEQWRKCFRNECVTAREAVHACGYASATSDLGTLHHLLLEVAGEGDTVSALRLGRYLGARAGRVVNGQRFLAAPRTGKGVPWSVEPV